jgi:uncharacterized protein (DUF952 family)
MLTLHMLPAEVWEAQESDTYEAATLASEGFIHTTLGYEQLVHVANHFGYREDPRAYVILAIDLYRVQAAWRFDDRDERFPHIYGPLNLDAVMGVQAFPRETDGTFLMPAAAR